MIYQAKIILNGLKLRNVMQNFYIGSVQRIDFSLVVCPFFANLKLI
jgi:hypothetical protein